MYGCHTYLKYAVLLFINCDGRSVKNVDTQRFDVNNCVPQTDITKCTIDDIYSLASYDSPDNQRSLIHHNMPARASVIDNLFCMDIFYRVPFSLCVSIKLLKKN